MKKAKTKLDEYLERDGEMEAKTIRAVESLWDRIHKLAEKKGNISVNLLMTAIMEKACDEEGIL